MTLEGRFRWLLEKMCREKGIDLQLIDDNLSYWENIDNIQKLAHVKLRKAKKRKVRRKKEPIKDIGKSLEEMGWNPDWQEDYARTEQYVKEKKSYEEEI